MWNLAFDELLDDFTSSPAQIKGFADDAAILLRGPDIHTLIEQGQEAVNRALMFGTANGLEFGADKTEAVVFTRKRIKTSDLPHLQMGNTVLEYSESVKYLGIILDNKLNFGPHIREKAKKAIRLLHCVRSSVGQLWGPNPYLVRWVLTGIVRPRITYGAIVWAKAASNHKKQLDRIQRLGLLAMAHVRQSTPTSGMEAALDMMPLDLYAQCAAVKAIARIRGRNSSYWDGIGCGRLRGHLFWGGKYYEGWTL